MSVSVRIKAARHSFGQWTPVPALTCAPSLSSQGAPAGAGATNKATADAARLEGGVEGNGDSRTTRRRSRGSDVGDGGSRSLSEAGSKTDKKRGRSLAGSEEKGVSDTEEGKERKLKLVKTSAGPAGADESESARGEEVREDGEGEGGKPIVPGGGEPLGGGQKRPAHEEAAGDGTGSMRVQASSEHAESALASALAAGGECDRSLDQICVCVHICKAVYPSVEKE